MTVNVIHQTDLFHTHCDPDDHWDLACQYALAYGGAIELKGILIDYPRCVDYGDPAIQAVSQMNYITGQAVPVGIGTSQAITSAEDFARFNPAGPEMAGVKMVLKILEEADEPVAVHIVGSCRDIAIAGKLRPDLFRDKCRAIYLNAGSSKEEEKLEYNVSLDPYSYREILSLPCVVYWMPCFEYFPVPPALDWQFTMGEYSTYYKIRQDAVLPYLSENLQKYFAYALGRVSDHRWLSYLKLPKNEAMLEYHGKLDRNMWSTCGILHGAGKTVTMDGQILPSDTPGIQPAYTFEPIEITCDPKGFTKWNVTEQPADRFIFRIKDLDSYQEAMTLALRTLLSTLP